MRGLGGVTAFGQLVQGSNIANVRIEHIMRSIRSITEESQRSNEILLNVLRTV